MEQASVGVMVPECRRQIADRAECREYHETLLGTEFQANGSPGSSSGSYGSGHQVEHRPVYPYYPQGPVAPATPAPPAPSASPPTPPETEPVSTDYDKWTDSTAPKYDDPEDAEDDAAAAAKPAKKQGRLIAEKPVDDYIPHEDW